MKAVADAASNLRGELDDGLEKLRLDPRLYRLAFEGGQDRLDPRDKLQAAVIEELVLLLDPEAVRSALSKAGFHDGPTLSDLSAVDGQRLHRVRLLGRIGGGLRDVRGERHRAIVRALNSEGVPTPRGGRWHSPGVQRCINWNLGT